MARTKYDNEFKVMVVELLKSGIKTQQVSDERAKCQHDKSLEKGV